MPCCGISRRLLLLLHMPEWFLPSRRLSVDTALRHGRVLLAIIRMSGWRQQRLAVPTSMFVRIRVGESILRAHAVARGA